jgi:hypothetical protein
MGAMKADVSTTLGEMFVKADTTTAMAGKVTFTVKNSDATMPGLAIVKAPATAPGGLLDTGTFVAKGTDLAPGASGMLTASLKPGRYELVCYMPGDYAAGQKLAFWGPRVAQSAQGSRPGALRRAAGSARRSVSLRTLGRPNYRFSRVRL